MPPWSSSSGLLFSQLTSPPPPASKPSPDSPPIRIGEVEFSTLREALQPSRTPTAKTGRCKCRSRDQIRPGSISGSPHLSRPARLNRRGGSWPLRRAGQELLEGRPLRHPGDLAPAIGPDDLKPQLAKFPESIRQAADALLAANQSDASKDRERLDAMVAEILNSTARSGADKTSSTAPRPPASRVTGSATWRRPGPGSNLFIGQARTEC